MKNKIIIIFFIFTQITFSQWELLNIPKGKVYSIASLGKYTYIGTRGYGVFVSSDTAGNWRQKLIVSDTLIFSALAVTNDFVVAGTLGYGIYFSFDNGNNWEQKNSGLKYYNIYSLAVNGNDVFAGTEDGSVFYSSSQGDSWKELFSGLSDDKLKVFTNSIFVNKDSIYIGTSDKGVYLSTDYGQSWNQFFVGLDSGQTRLKVNTIVRKGINVIFIGTADQGVYVSTNNGETWKQKNKNLPNMKVYCFAVDGNNVFAGIQDGTGLNETLYFSSNNGNSWNEMTPQNIHSQIYTLAINGNYYFAGSFSGLYISPGKGNYWYYPYPQMFISGFSGIYSKGEDLFITSASVYDGLNLSTDYGYSWTVKSVDISGKINCFTFNEKFFFLGMGDGKIYRSDDNCNSWKEVCYGLNNVLAINSILIKKDMVFASTSNKKFFVSKDFGESWDQKNNGTLTNQILKLVDNDNVIFASTEGSGILMSCDNGESWIPRNAGFSDIRVLSFEVSGRYLYVGYDHGFLVSSDYGITWQHKDSALIPYWDTLPVPVQSIGISNNVIFIRSMLGIFYTTDNGDNWIKNNNNGNFGGAFAFLGKYVFSIDSYLLFRARLSDFGITGVKEPNGIEKVMAIYPNPAGDYLFISPDKHDCLEFEGNIRIFNMLGECLKALPVHDPESQQIDISGLPAGAYYVVFGNECKIFVKK